MYFHSKCISKSRYKYKEQVQCFLIFLGSTSSEISVGDPSEIMPPGNRPKKKRMQSGSSLPESLNPLVDGAEVEDIHDDLLELPVEGIETVVVFSIFEFLYLYLEFLTGYYIVCSGK